MIEERGTIIEVRGSLAIIRTERGSECDGCGSKALCQPSDDDTIMTVEADNPINAQVGQLVFFTVGAATVLKAGMMLYLIPLICFIVGVVIGQEYGPDVFPDSNRDIVSAILGFIFLGFAFFGLRIYGKRAETAEGFRPTVIKVIK